jgi:hypothetical protein
MLRFNPSAAMRFRSCTDLQCLGLDAELAVKAQSLGYRLVCVLRTVIREELLSRGLTEQECDAISAALDAHP